MQHCFVVATTGAAKISSHMGKEQRPEQQIKAQNIIRGSGGWDGRAEEDGSPFMFRRFGGGVRPLLNHRLSRCPSFARSIEGNSEPGRMRLPGWSFSHTTSPGGLVQTLPSAHLFLVLLRLSSLCYMITWQIKTSWKLHFKGQQRHWCGIILGEQNQSQRFRSQTIQDESSFLARGISCWFNRIRHVGLQRRKSQALLLVNHLTQM